ncbi:MAG: LysR substrate-binding domain-containing protein, partial [Microbacterium sp.]
ITQPAVTRGLHEVEGVLGVQLFTRDHRGVTMTIFGEAFVEHARELLGRLQQAEKHVRELAAADVGTVSVGAHLTGSNVLLPRAILGLKEERPGVTVIVREGSPRSMIAGLLDGSLDVTVGRLVTNEPAKGLEQYRLYEEPTRLTCRIGHPARELAAPTLADLAGYTWLFPVEGTSLRQEIEGEFRRWNIPLPRNRIECTSLATIRTLLLESDAVALLPFLIIDADPDLVALPTPLPTIRRVVGMTVRKGPRHSPSTELLMKHLGRVGERVRRNIDPAAAVASLG